jgi:hypothetical protein
MRLRGPAVLSSRLRTAKAIAVESKQSKELHVNTSTSVSYVASNADGILLGTVLPFSRDEGRRRESHSLSHTQFDPHSTMPAVSESIAKRGIGDFGSVFKSPLTPVAFLLLPMRPAGNASNVSGRIYGISIVLPIAVSVPVSVYAWLGLRPPETPLSELHWSCV